MLNDEVYTTNFHTGSERDNSHSPLLGLLHEMHVKLIFLAPFISGPVRPILEGDNLNSLALRSDEDSHCNNH